MFLERGSPVEDGPMGLGQGEGLPAIISAMTSCGKVTRVASAMEVQAAIRRGCSRGGDQGAFSREGSCGFPV
jgi:hypothetical protein